MKTTAIAISGSAITNKVIKEEHMKKIIATAIGMAILAGCSARLDFVPSEEFTATTTIRSVGLGAAPANSEYSAERLQLLAIKASRMDAYRSLVEKVYGVRISSNVTIRALAVENDSFKGKVDGLIQMAEIVEVRPINGGSYETIMEVEMTPEFREFVLSEYSKAD